MRLRSACALGAAIILPLLCTASCILHDKMQDSRFARVAIGMAQQDVIDTIGRPARVLRGGETGGLHAPTSCSEEYVYSSAAAPLLPWYPTVCFGNDGRVVSKYTYSSP